MEKMERGIGSKEERGESEEERAADGRAASVARWCCCRDQSGRLGESMPRLEPKLTAEAIVLASTRRDLSI